MWGMSSSSNGEWSEGDSRIFLVFNKIFSLKRRPFVFLLFFLSFFFLAGGGRVQIFVQIFFAGSPRAPTIICSLITSSHCRSRM